MIVDGKKIAKGILNEAASLLKALAAVGRGVKLAVVLVGDDKPSQTYVEKKAEAAKSIGLDFNLHRFSASVSADFLIKKISQIQRDKKLSGLIVQLPLPAGIDSKAVINAIKPEVDVDCLTYPSLGRLISRTNVLPPPTAAAIISILNYYQVKLRGAKAVIVGAGDLVGRPLFITLLNEGATVTVCNQATGNLAAFTKGADILISAAGKKDLIRGRMIKKGAVVLDAGFSVLGGKAYGDINFSEVSRKARLVTPTPGGIGPITVAHLLWNTVKSAERVTSNAPPTTYDLPKPNLERQSKR